MFKPVTTTFILLILTISSYAARPDISFGKANKEELEMNFYAPDSSASAVVLGDYGNSRFTYNQHKGLQLLFTRHTRIKILNTQGYAWADVEIPLYHDGNDHEDVSQIKGFTFNLKNGKIEKTKLKSNGKFKERQSEHWDVVKFTMPDVTEGAVIEYSYTIVSDFLFNLQDWEFQRAIPVAWSEYEVRIPEYFYYKQLFQGYYPLAVNENSTVSDNFNVTVRERSGGEGFSSPVQSSVTNHRIAFNTNIYHWAAQDIPALEEEPFMTTLDDYTMKMEFELASTNFPGEPVKNYTTTWEKIDKELLDDKNFGDLLKRRGGFKDKVAELTQGKGSPEEKLVAIYDFVRDQIQWTGTNALFAGQSFRQTLEHKSGSAADINLLLLAMLREAGIAADPVVLSTRDHGILRKSFPMLNQFNYVIARALIGDNQFLLDATESSCPYDILPVRCLNAEGRLVNEENGDKWVDLLPGADTKHFAMVSLHMDQEQHLIGEIANSSTQYDALSLRHKINANHNVDTYVAETKEHLHGWDVKKYDLQDLENLNRPVKEEYEVALTDHFMVAGDRVYLNTVLADRMTENPFKQKSRTYPVDFAYPFNKIYMLNLSLPEGYTCEEVPENKIVALPNQGGLYAYTVRVMGNTVQIMSKLELKKSRFYAEEYPYLREFFDMIVAKQSEQLVLRKNK